jgi:hypothetical protein
MALPEDREAALSALALEQPKDRRAAFLYTVSGENPTLRARLDALLEAPEEAKSIRTPEAAPTVRRDWSPDSRRLTVSRAQLSELGL